MFFSYKNILFISLILCTIFSFWKSRIFSIPLIYIPIYIYATLLFLSQKRIIVQKYFLLLFILILLIQIPSYNNIVDIESNVVYTCMWIVNIFVGYVVFSYDKNNIIFESVSMYSIILIIFMGGVYFFWMPPAVFFGSIGININLVAFIAVIGVYDLFFIKKNKSLAIFIGFISLLTFSRMHFSMLLVGLYFIFFNYNKKNMALFVIFIFSILSLIIIATLYFEAGRYSFLINNYIETDFLYLGDIDIDKRRIYLMVGVVETIKNLFPFGTGIGVKNLTYYSSFYLEDVYSHNIRIGLAHNFYLSYLGMIGLLFFPFLLVIIYPLKKVVSDYSVLYLIFLIGIIFNEYITAPFFWIVMAMAMKPKLSKYNS